MVLKKILLDSTTVGFCGGEEEKWGEGLQKWKKVINYAVNWWAVAG